MSMKDIEKLKEKFDRDPNAKIFLPLAEEYRKEGMLDEAVGVLQIGLGKNPAYTTARVLLGKIYLEKGLPDEARRELESVVQAVPDNLYAHKKLAEIYREAGETELAIKAMKAVIRLNPMDDDIISSLKEVESAVAPGTSAAPASGTPAREEGEKEEEAYGMAGRVEEVLGSTPDMLAGHAEEELSAFKDLLFGGETDAGGAQEIEFPEEAAAPEEDSAFGDILESIRAMESESQAAPGEERDLEEADAFDESVTSDVSYVSGEGLSLDEQAFRDAGSLRDVSATLRDADRFIAEDDFAGAMSIYRKVLASDPYNRSTLQRVEELRALLKLTGKDKELPIEKLNAFLEGIYKRRDEFFGRS